MTVCIRKANKYSRSIGISVEKGRNSSRSIGISLSSVLRVVLRLVPKNVTVINKLVDGGIENRHWRYLEPPSLLMWISVRLVEECNYYFHLSKVCCVIRCNMKYFNLFILLIVQ